ncbi:MAG: tyrosine--tRNA ligase [Candidatus Lernaella stagnicola]|nr:tyrosine--tRNA ligase [Candidatus Lernaella stagnicola]
MELDVERTLAVIRRGAHEIVPEDQLQKKVAKALSEKRPLRIKVGIDPTAPDVHIGHLVPYGKMRDLQDLGHIGVVIIGDYTARIGDPTGREQMRTALTKQEVQENAAKYMEQLYKVLDPDRTEIRHQTEWYGDFDMADTLHLLQEVTLAQMLQHETFRSRYENNVPLGLHELCYPVLQGYDSVAVQADIEMGDPAQKFNVLVGRDMMERRGMEPQLALLMPILIGTDGKEKMSKSMGNHVGVLMSPTEQYGRTMSIPDDIMENWYKLFLGFAADELARIREKIGSDPMGAKKDLAAAIVERLHGRDAAREAAEDFDRKFSKRTLELDNIPEAPLADFDPPTVVNVVATFFGMSNSEVKRLVNQGGVKFDGDTLSDPRAPLPGGGVLKVGKKKWLRLIG